MALQHDCASCLSQDIYRPVQSLNLSRIRPICRSYVALQLNLSVHFRSRAKEFVTVFRKNSISRILAHSSRQDHKFVHGMRCLAHTNLTQILPNRCTLFLSFGAKLKPQLMSWKIRATLAFHSMERLVFGT
jgi:hypothetical protein